MMVVLMVDNDSYRSDGDY